MLKRSTVLAISMAAFLVPASAAPADVLDPGFGNGGVVGDGTWAAGTA